MAEGGTIAVLVCYAPPAPQAPVMLALDLAPGATLAQAIEASGVAQQLQGVDPALCRTGIWGRLKGGDTVLRQYDRVELYRPLIADPMEARRRRASKKTAVKA